MPSNAAFRREYARLNPAQKQAVDAIEGPVMVMAGPGTGKTQVLALRIANILLATDTSPENILCLTFTESGALSMRRRLAQIIGPAAYRIVINTFHGFANDVIRRYPEEFPRIIGAVPGSEVDQIRILEELVETEPLTDLRPAANPFFYIRAIQGAINTLKREGVTPAAFTAFLKTEQAAFKKIPGKTHRSGRYRGLLKTEYRTQEKRLAKNVELARLYARYQECLTERRLYDYTDMIMEVARALGTNRNLCLALQEEHQYILVDEHQDTNNAQNQILELLAGFHAAPNLFVVGDEKQAIFRFQGASLENFLYFRKKYPSALLVVLEDNYRSSQVILDAAHRLLPGPARLTARARHAPRPVRLAEFSTVTVEEQFLATDIAARIAAGTAPETIALLYRDNRDAAPLAAALERRGVPYQIESDQDIFSDPDIRKLLVLLRAADDLGDDGKLIAALHVDFLDVPPLALLKLLRDIRRERRPVAERAATIRATQRAFRFLSTLYRRGKNEGLAEVFEAVVRDSGILAYLLARPDGREKIEKINGLFDEAKALVERQRGATLHDFIEYLDRIAAHGLLVRRRSDVPATGRVRLMTAHRSKGLEFAHVYITGAVDGHWGSRRRRELITLPPALFALPNESRTVDDDERRLFYVALTRARETLSVTYARQDAERRELLPSVFVAELDPRLLNRVETASFEAEAAAHREAVFAVPHSEPLSLRDPDYIRRVFLDSGFAVTHLNNYLECPWKYFYTNLFRLPQAPEPHQLYGTAIHEALRRFLEQGAEADDPRAFLLAQFDDALARTPLAAPALDEYRTRGRTALGGYYDVRHTEWGPRAIAEFSVAGVMLTPEIRLTGKIDKVERLDDRGTVRVTDYKTGAPKTRGDIEGTTKSSRGDLKRQLVFYRLLLDRYDGGRLTMASGTIDFVEPDDRGRYHRETFTIESSEVAALEALIKKTAAEIIGLAFWDRTCGTRGCPYCALRGLMH